MDSQPVALGARLQFTAADSLRRVRAAGSRVLQDPEEYPWGSRALVEDPDGRLVELFGRRETR